MAYLMTAIPEASIGHRHDPHAPAEEFSIHLSETHLFSVSKEFIDKYDADTIEGHLNAMGMARIIRWTDKRILLTTGGLIYS